MNGSQHICFTDSAGKALFSIPDNGLLCLFYGNGDRHFAVCHRLDDTHAEIDGVNYSLPDFAYGPDMVKSLMKKLDMNEKGFALLMNVAPSTVRLWTSGAAQPCGTAKRLMQIYETGPEIVGKIAGGQLPADGRD